MATQKIEQAMRRARMLIAGSGAFSLIGVVSGLAAAGPVPDYDFDWAVIGQRNNASVPIGDPYAQVYGRGSVGYRYRISKYEVTTTQWMAYVNTFSTQSDDNTFFARPSFWGAMRDDAYDGPGARFVLRDTPNAARMPVFGLTWYEAAEYVNWLHNGKSSNIDSVADGAYDTGTFGKNPDGTISDQRTHHADAKFWIPTWDEWLKAAHYDPETGNWNRWPTADNTKPMPGMPGVGTTSAGVQPGDCDPDILICPYDIPLGAYDFMSAYGLYDLSGGTSEWTEEVFYNEVRGAEGLRAGAYFPEDDIVSPDIVFQTDAYSPWNGGFRGLRIAGVIPAPGVSVAGYALIGLVFQRRR